MNIHHATSFLGAQHFVLQNRNKLLAEVQQRMLTVDENQARTEGLARPFKYSYIKLRTLIDDAFSIAGWSVNHRFEHTDAPKRVLWSIDYWHDNVGIELSVGKAQFIYSAIFLNFPKAFRMHNIKVAVAMIPTRALARDLVTGVANYDDVIEALKEAESGAINFPLLVCGFGPGRAVCQVEEHYAEIEEISHRLFGKPFAKAILGRETAALDFKVRPPKDGFSKIVAAMANSGGGMIVVGIDDQTAKPVEIDEVTLDKWERQVTSEVDSQLDPSQSILVRKVLFEGLRVLSIEVPKVTKPPVVVNGKVYLRKGTQCLPATSEEIRRLIIS